METNQRAFNVCGANIVIDTQKSVSKEQAGRKAKMLMAACKTLTTYEWMLRDGLSISEFRNLVSGCGTPHLIAVRDAYCG